MVECLVCETEAKSGFKIERVSRKGKRKTVGTLCQVCWHDFLGSGSPEQLLEIMKLVQDRG